MIRMLQLLTMLSTSYLQIDAFTLQSTPFPRPTPQRMVLSSKKDELRQEIRQFTVKQLKQELSDRNISTRGLLEKEDLVNQLVQARSETPTTPFTSSDSPKDDQVIESTLYLTHMDKSVRIAAVDATLYPSEQPYATIHVEAVHSKGQHCQLSLLLDTACSGIVLRPQAVREKDITTFQTPVTTTGAGGTIGASTERSMGQVANLDQLLLDGQSLTKTPLPAAIQDIGALPRPLDGIVGVSVLTQFAAVELDFGEGRVRFFRQTPTDTSARVETQSSMRLLPMLGIYTVPVYLGGRGPVNLLVDTGAASTLLGWKGVCDLGLERDSSYVAKLSTPMGALGSDNVAIELSHRLHVSSSLKLGTKAGKGISLAGSGRLAVDIGDIPIIDSLQDQGVGGILGIDAMMRSAAARFTFGSNPTVTFYSRDDLL